MSSNYPKDPKYHGESHTVILICVPLCFTVFLLNVETNLEGKAALSLFVNYFLTKFMRMKSGKNY